MQCMNKTCFLRLRHSLLTRLRLRRTIAIPFLTNPASPAMIAERKGYSSKKPRKTNRFSGFFAVLGGKTWFFETRKKDLILRLQNGGFSKNRFRTDDFEPISCFRV